MKLSFYRRYRGSWFSYERQPQYVQIGISNPHKHAWWALSIYLFF
jgi:hypothetical protein